MMTAQYLCGEIGTRLAQLEAMTPAPPLHASVHHLRLEAETTPPTALHAVATRAFEVADDICWHVLGGGEISRFSMVAALASELHEFAESANLLEP